MLEAIVFVCGAALMGLEFLAARMLAPTLGSSLFVWGSIISIVMVALSLGYWLGGQIADRFGSTRTLAPVIALAGFFTVIIPALSAAVLPALGGLGPRAGSLLASAVVFFAPSIMLAMVSPLGVRLAARRGVGHIGRSAGSLYAISTAGSIAGTIATAFWLIPLLSLDALVVGIGILLFGVALMAENLPRHYEEPALERAPQQGSPVAPRWLRRATTAVVLLGVVIGGTTLARPTDVAPGNAPGERVIYRKDTQYHRLYVTEDDEQRHLRFDRSHQTAMYLDDPFETSFRYPNYLHLAFALKPDAKRVLVIGLGGGSAVKRIWRDYPDSQVDAVEIDPVVVDVAKRYFEVPDDPRIRLITEDGRRFLQDTSETYDVIIVDAYYADALPFHLTTKEFFEEAKTHLAPDGVLAYNLIASAEGSRSRLFRSMHKTVSTVWEQLWVFPIGIGTEGNPTENRNIIVLATDNHTGEREFLLRIANRAGGRVTVPNFPEYAKDLYAERVQTEDVPLLTDQHAPTDSLIDVQ